MAGLPLSFWAQAAGAGLQGVLGIGQLIGGALMNPERPTYQIPDEIKNMLALRQMNLGGRMAGATQAQANIMQSQANTVGAYQGTLRNPNAILAGVSAAQGQTNRAFGNLGAMEAQDYQRRLAGLEGAQRSMAQYRDKAFDINEMQPYVDEARTKAALIGAGLRNISGGAAGVAGAVGENEYMNMVQKMYGLDGGNQAQPESRFDANAAGFNFGSKQGQFFPNPNDTSGAMQSVGELGYNVAPAVQPQPIPQSHVVGPLGYNTASNVVTGDSLPTGSMDGVTSSSPRLGNMMRNIAFNNWVKQMTGKNVTEFSQQELILLSAKFGQ